MGDQRVALFLSSFADCLLLLDQLFLFFWFGLDLWFFHWLCGCLGHFLGLLGFLFCGGLLFCLLGCWGLLCGCGCSCDCGLFFCGWSFNLDRAFFGEVLFVVVLYFNLDFLGFFVFDIDLNLTIGQEQVNGSVIFGRKNVWSHHGEPTFTKNILVAFLLIISGTLSGYIVDELLIFFVVHAVFSLDEYYSRILLLPDLYSFGNVSTSSNWSKVVPRFSSKSFITELPPRLKVPKREAKLIIMKGPFEFWVYIWKYINRLLNYQQANHFFLILLFKPINILIFTLKNHFFCELGKALEKFFYLKRFNQWIDLSDWLTTFGTFHVFGFPGVDWSFWVKK